MYFYNCDIIRVVDGDTIDVAIDLGFDIIVRERVRLYGVDTPEVYGIKASEAGKVASDFVKSWLGVREMTGEFRLESKVYNARDKYGRCLGVITWVDAITGNSESLNQALLDSGNATIYK